MIAIRLSPEEGAAVVGEAPAMLRKIAIAELDSGWRVTEGNNAREYPTAVEALDAIRHEERARAESVGRAVAVIEWTTCSRVGTAVVHAISKAAPR